MRVERTGPGPVPSAGESLRKAADALVRLVKEHLSLARVELRKDLRRAGKDVAFALAGLPLALVGWALLMVALAIAVAPVVGAAGAFAIVGALNLGTGAAVSLYFARRLAGNDRPDLDETTKVLEEDRQWLQTLKRSRKMETAEPLPRSQAATPP